MWISRKATLAIHGALLAEHGGASGFIAEHLLDSALESPKNHFAHWASDLFELAAAYARAMTQDHPFVDGNKRVALTIALTFLERNGVEIAAPEPEAVAMVLGLTARSVDAAVFAEWLRRNARRVPVRRAPSSKPARRTPKKK